MNFIDTFLNKITMYRLVLYGLTVLTVIAFILNALGALELGFIPLLFSLTTLLFACDISNYFFAKLFKVGPNVESVWITAFILFFTLAPIASVSDALWVLTAGVLAMASKYILTIRKRHLFNPVAIALVLLSIMGSGIASWWVATPIMLPFVLLLGLLIVRKTRRFDTWWAFMLTAVSVGLIHTFGFGEPLGATFVEFFTSWPLIFFSTIMLTEPLTLPPTRGLRIVYAVIVGALSMSTLNVGVLHMAPPLALVIGNLYAYSVSSRQRVLLTLASRTALTSNIYEFSFTPDEPLRFSPGQYIEWTLPHSPSDSRGNRRYFTIASAPEEKTIKLGVRIDPKNHSSFKGKLLSLGQGDTLSIGSLSGDFVLPKDPSLPLVWIAGGIGITPFISMIRSLMLRREKRMITLFYAVNTKEDVAYKELLIEAEKMGITIIPVIGEYLTEHILTSIIPKTKDHVWYLSGPHGMVAGYKKLLHSMNIPRKNIKTDYFPGF